MCAGIAYVLDLQAFPFQGLDPVLTPLTGAVVCTSLPATSSAPSNRLFSCAASCIGPLRDLFLVSLGNLDLLVVVRAPRSGLLRCCMIVCVCVEVTT